MCNLFNDHAWTSANERGIKPTQQQLDAGLAGFKDYAKMYCDRCGHISELSNW